MHVGKELPSASTAACARACRTCSACAWLHCAGTAVLRAWLHCAGYWAKGTPAKGPSAGLSVRAGVQCLARPRGPVTCISQTLPACLVVDRN